MALQRKLLLKEAVGGRRDEVRPCVRSVGTDKLPESDSGSSKLACA